MTDLSKQEKFIELRAKGMSFAKISDILSVSKPTLIKWSKDLEIDINNMRAIEQEALREKYLVSKESRLELLKEHFEKVKQEMAKRDLSELPTEKLFSLNFKLLQEMKAEENISPVFARTVSTMELSGFTKVDEWTA